MRQWGGWRIFVRRTCISNSTTCPLKSSFCANVAQASSNALPRIARIGSHAIIATMPSSAAPTAALLAAASALRCSLDSRADRCM